MRPYDVRRILSHRRAYLQAKVEQAAPTQPTHLWRGEVAALDTVLSLLQLEPGTDAAAIAKDDQSRVERARESVAKAQARCSCERCPVHAGDRGAETAAMRAARGPTVGEWLNSEATKARKDG